MWLILGGLSVAGAVAWMKLGAPLSRMLELHDDMSAANRRIPAPSGKESAAHAVDPMGATGDLRNLAKSVGPTQMAPSRPQPAPSAEDVLAPEASSRTQA
jgi:hypothetical protein